MKISLSKTWAKLIRISTATLGGVFTYRMTGRLLLPLLVASMISGCGFKLRSQPVLSERLGSIYLQEQKPANALQYYLRKNLLLAGAKLTSDLKQASIILQLASPILKKTRLNTNIDIQTRLYTLTYSVAVTVTSLQSNSSKEGKILEKTFIKQTRNKIFHTSHNLVVNADSTLDATGQLDTAVQEMQNKLVGKILDYLQAQQFAP